MSRSAKTLVSFRLSDTTRDELQECVDLVRRRDEEERNYWMLAKRDRTDMVRMAVANLLVQLKKEREARDEAAKAPAIADESKPRRRPRSPATSKRATIS